MLDSACDEPGVFAIWPSANSEQSALRNSARAIAGELLHHFPFRRAANWPAMSTNLPEIVPDSRATRRPAWLASTARRFSSLFHKTEIISVYWTDTLLTLGACV